MVTKAKPSLDIDSDSLPMTLYGVWLSNGEGGGSFSCNTSNPDGRVFFVTREDAEEESEIFDGHEIVKVIVTKA